MGRRCIWLWNASRARLPGGHHGETAGPGYCTCGTVEEWRNASVLLSPLEAAAKTKGNAEAVRSSRSDVIRRGRGAWSRLRLVTFRLLFILRGDIPPAHAFLAFQDSPLLILGASPASAGWRAAEWEELARRPWKRSNLHLQRRKRKKKTRGTRK